MKKLIALLLVASVSATLIGCGKASTDDASTPAPSKIKDKTPGTSDE